MSVLQIPRVIYEALLDQARRMLPDEACGILAGSGDTVMRHFEMTNADRSPYHYTMIPEEQFSVVKAIREANLEMLGIYHSHPQTPARPSQKDIQMALTPNVVYLIISLSQVEPDVRGFSINNGRTAQIPLRIVDLPERTGQDERQ